MRFFHQLDILDPSLYIQIALFPLYQPSLIPLFKLWFFIQKLIKIKVYGLLCLAFIFFEVEIDILVIVDIVIIFKEGNVLEYRIVNCLNSIDHHQNSNLTWMDIDLFERSDAFSDCLQCPLQVQKSLIKHCDTDCHLDSILSRHTRLQNWD